MKMIYGDDDVGNVDNVDNVDNAGNAGNVASQRDTIRLICLV